MSVFLAPIINSQTVDNNGNPLSGGLIYVYLAGTSTPVTTYSDNLGTIPNTFPIVLNSLGVSNQGEIWLTGGSSYKYVIQNSLGIVQRTLDNLRGINDSSVAADQWILFPAPPTYISATSFSLVGDQTQTFQVNRRVKTQNTGGIVYSTITTSVYSAPNTIITVSNTSGVLDSGLSQVYYGVISIQDSSVIGLLLNVRTFIANATYTPTPGTTSVIVEVLGGGGAGGGTPVTGAATVSVGGGGGAGGYAKSRLTSGFAGVAIVVGTAGGAVAGAAGGNGTISSFGGGIAANGGNGGAAAVAAAVGSGAGAVGGTGVGGNLLNIQGGRGFAGIFNSASTIYLSGSGADSLFGTGGVATPGTTGSASTGSGAVGFGSGGGGAATAFSSGVVAGGNGAPGLVIVSEYT